MKSQVAGTYQIAEIGHTHARLPWMVRHGSWLMARFLVKAPGMTAFAAVYGE